MIANLRNIVCPPGGSGCRSPSVLIQFTAVMASLFLIPTAAFEGSTYRRLFGLEGSAKACFARSLIALADWLQLWRLNCRLASMSFLATNLEDFEMEDKWKFIQTRLAEKSPANPVFVTPKTTSRTMSWRRLAFASACWRRVARRQADPPGEGCELRRRARVVARESPTLDDALSVLGADGSSTQAKTLASVWRPGRSGANTDHSCVMVSRRTESG